MFEDFVRSTDPATRLRDFALAMLEGGGRLLRRHVEGLETADLEWQAEPGSNTIGMLLAHLAVVEAYWVHVVPGGIVGDALQDAEVRRRIGLGLFEDGLPLAPDGEHPAPLRGWSPERYLDLLTRTRDGALEVLRTWEDATLGETAAVDGRTVTRTWILHRLVEHQAWHGGQIAQIRGLRERRRST